MTKFSISVAARQKDPGPCCCGRLEKRCCETDEQVDPRYHTCFAGFNSNVGTGYLFSFFALKGSANTSELAKGLSGILAHVIFD